MTEEDRLKIVNAAYWLRQAADYVTDLHEKLGIQSTTYADSLRIEALELDSVVKG